MSRGEKVSFGEFDKFTKFVFSEKFPKRWRTRTCRRNRQNQVRFVTRTGYVIVKMFDFSQKSQKNIEQLSLCGLFYRDPYDREHPWEADRRCSSKQSALLIEHQ